MCNKSSPQFDLIHLYRYVFLMLILIYIGGLLHSIWMHPPRFSHILNLNRNEFKQQQQKYFNLRRYKAKTHQKSWFEQFFSSVFQSYSKWCCLINMKKSLKITSDDSFPVIVDFHFRLFYFSFILWHFKIYWTLLL